MSSPNSVRGSEPVKANDNSGIMAAVGAYSAWGVLPVLFHFLEPAGSVLVVAERALWSVLFVGLLLAFTTGFAEVKAVLRNWRTLAVLASSALLLFGNWLIYVWAVESGQVLEVSFGYFINPIVNVAIGIALLGEKQNRVQYSAIAAACVAIAIQWVALGKVPLVALSLALTFAAYGYIRKTAKVGSSAGLFVETIVVSPIAMVLVGLYFAANGAGVHADPGLMALLVLTGPATALPLILFAYGIRRLRMATIGMLQYLSPSITFVLAITYFGESIDPVRLASFVLIWVALAIYSWDGFRRYQRDKA
jgi:chloramphenicol-sensitive protein RarD